LECYFHYALERRGVNGEGQEGSIKTRVGAECRGAIHCTQLGGRFTR
jgi:hypothetical protein